MTSPALDQYLLLRAFVDELARSGMLLACTSPGSRSTPIVLSLVGAERLTCHSHVDERTAGFFAVGAAKASGRAVAVSCTSGTAAAELTPAVVEAHEARVPLLVLTADRPPELREVGAGQAIDQVKLFGANVRWFFEVGTHEATAERLRWMRTLACRAYAVAMGPRPGPVHLNFALREPLVVDEELPVDETGRADGRPYVVWRESRHVAVDEAEHLSQRLLQASRPVLIAGRCERRPPLGKAASALAAAASVPLLADPLSGARSGAGAVAHYDALLRDESFASDHRPDLVLRVGDLPTSKPLRAWLGSLGDVPQVRVDAEGGWQDPDSVLSDVVVAEPAALLEKAGEAVRDVVASDWLDSWRRDDALAASAIGRELESAGVSEPGVAAWLGRELSAETILFVASSMPVRDVETFFPSREDPVRVLSSRGANGIDGTVASALGAAAAGDAPVVLLIGDVALAHDIGSLLSARRLGPPDLTIVLLDNEGGGIFDFLPVAGSERARAAYERHIATPTGLDFAALAAAAGATYRSLDDLSALSLTSGRGLSLLHARTDRAATVALHRRIWAAVSAAIRPAR